MRHRIAGHKLNGGKDEQEALRRNLIKQLFEHERIRTTRAKARAVRGPAERLITLAKRGNDAGDIYMVNARRRAAAKLSDAEAVRKLFDDIAPRYENRQGGYTRSHTHVAQVRPAPEMVLLELVED